MAPRSEGSLFGLSRRSFGIARASGFAGLLLTAIVPVTEAPAQSGGAETPPARHDIGVRWLNSLQGQASQLDVQKPEVDRQQAMQRESGRLAQRVAAESTKTFALPLPGRERGGEPPADLFKGARSGELFATGLSSRDLETVEAAGFVASVPTRFASGVEAVRLSAPGMARDEALRALNKIVPLVSVAPNEAYTIYTPPVGEADGVRTVIERDRVEPAAPGPCSRETCFGPELISWRDTLGACAHGVRVGIIDTSFDLTHPAFRQANAEQANFLDGASPSAYDWHGTAVLALLAGNPDSGTPGLLPEADYLLAAAFQSDAAGNASTDTVRLLAALSWLDQRGVDIVNMSFTGPRDPAIEQAISNMRKKGVVFVAAAGNKGPMAEPSYPAAYPHVIAVTAVNRRGESYRHANRGDYIDVSAPGVDIFTALPASQQGYRTGTSFAVPFVTAIAATRALQSPPVNAALGGVDHGAAALRNLAVRDLGPPGRDPIYGSGLVLAPESCVPGEDAVARAAPSAPDVALPPAPNNTFFGAGAAGFSN